MIFGGDIAELGVTILPNEDCFVQLITNPADHVFMKLPQEREAYSRYFGG